MTDPTPHPPDDEVISAVLDGEATAAERALVEASPEARARLAGLRAAAEHVAAPVAGLDPTTVDRLVGAALDAAMPAGPTAATAPARVASLDRRRARGGAGSRPDGRRLGPAVAAAAAVLVLLGGSVLVALQLGGRSASDEAASTDSTATAIAPGAPSPSDGESAPGAANDLSAAEAAPPAADAGSGVATTAVARDLGAFPDATGLLDAVVAEQLAFAGAGPPAGLDALRASLPCLATVPTSAPDGGWALVAGATVATRPVLVLSEGTTPAERLVVVDAASCEVLDERTR